MTIANVVAEALAGVAESDVGDAILAATITRHVEGAYDPITDTETGGSDTTLTGSCVLGEAPNAEAYKDIGVIVMPNDIEAYLFQFGQRILTTDTVSVGSSSYDIVFSTDSSAGTWQAVTVVLRIK